MKKIILILAVISMAISSCKKEEENKVKQVRLKTYTHDYYERTAPASVDKFTIEYNSKGKIAKVILENNGAFYRTVSCIYNASNVLDSVTERNAAGTLTYFYKIECNGDNKITKTNTTTITYNSNGLVEKKTYSNGTYFRISYDGDSVNLYYKDLSVSEDLKETYKFSTTIKNPFLITGFENEAYATGLLFYYNNAFNALLPFIEIQEIPKNYPSSNYTFIGDFKGYPLQRNDLTNTIIENRSKETFTYEEF